MRFQKTMRILSRLAFSALLLQYCAGSAGLPTAENFAQALRNEQTATTFERLVEGGGGFENLLGKEKYTLIVPMDATFAALGIDELMVLMNPANAAAGTEIVKGHIATGAFSPDKLPSAGNLTLLNGKTVPVSNPASGLQIGGATVVKTIKTKQGYLYFVNRILK
jgi:uncharacterized surface protein with fasciclin (FAS1) repeats